MLMRLFMMEDGCSSALHVEVSLTSLSAGQVQQHSINIHHNLFFSCPLVWHHTLLSPLLCLFFLRYSFLFLPNTTFHCHTTSQTGHNSDKLLILSSTKIFFQAIHSILIPAVTAASHPPLVFNLSPK